MSDKDRWGYAKCFIAQISQLAIEVAISPEGILFLFPNAGNVREDLEWFYVQFRQHIRWMFMKPTLMGDTAMFDWRIRRKADEMTVWVFWNSFNPDTGEARGEVRIMTNPFELLPRKHEIHAFLKNDDLAVEIVGMEK